MPGLEILIYIVILVFSVIIHEVAHGYAAEMGGDPTARLSGRLTLNPIPHVDLVGSIMLPALLILAKAGFIIGWAKPVPVNPYNFKSRPRLWSGITAVAGVLANFLVAFIFGLIIRFSGELGIDSQAFLSVAKAIVSINIVLGVFNLVPIPPLDGSKLLFSILPYRFFYIQEFLERYALFLVLILIFFLWNIIAPIALFFFQLFTGTSF